MHTNAANLTAEELEELELLGTMEDEPAAAPHSVCSVCLAPQFETPSGITCKNGHGGADSAATLEDPPSPASQGAAASAVAPVAASRSGYEGIIFDIETGPLPLDEIWKVVDKFDPASIQPYPTFDESAVKYGNTKDETLKAKKLEECRAAHATAAAAHAAKNLTAEADYITGVLSKAALSPLTGRVLAIGYYHTEDESTEVDVISSGNIGTQMTEASLLTIFWNIIEAALEHARIIGHNTHSFDLPFLIQRSWLLNIDVPRGVMEGRFFNKKFVDTMQVWACGKVGGNSFTKLDTIAKAFGVGAKTGDGAMFAELLEKDRPAAIEYLKNDVAMTYEVAKRMGVCK